MVNNLLKLVGNLQKSEIKKLVDKKTGEFKELGKKSNDELFKELCFCLMTANFSAQRAIDIQNAIGDGFLNLPENDLAKKLKVLGHRFPNARAKYIAEARRHKNNLKTDRQWLVRNIKGLGHKEASHFLRNTGRKDCAIIDFHIIDILTRHNIIQKPKTLTPARYLKIENRLKELADKLNINLAELDLYLWYLETGKVLK
jgi:N-glycosylase/DNA lyase